ncbi:Ubiquitin-like-conjugating enzyme ATG10 [Pseudocercospora fuligena]|uniref:Ubiquitin-like-conjugating enzyme ATG10 n=1 Tax=Pseudocercospora fuligena TaxID=685502 RepID=A0A8H6VIN2_9PEZI|nr:Ubiquitin-like-conjugating enzyme ATG10 [Pseudocercospora fuligena]
MSLSKEAFEAGIANLWDSWQTLKDANEWEEVKLLQQDGVRFLRIKRSLRVSESNEASEPPEQTGGEDLEDDPEALQTRHSTAQKEVLTTYDIVHSPSYQVPVLYLTAKYGSSSSPLSIAEMHRLLVPDAFRQQVEAVGIMGALSMTDHPVTNLPAYFVHPCRTQEAMQAVLSGREAGPVEYLALWLGLAGGSVGLSVPVPLMQALQLEGR